MDGSYRSREDAARGMGREPDPRLAFRTLRESGFDPNVAPPDPRWSFVRRDADDGLPTGVIERGVVLMLVGMPGVGKSWLQLLAACAVSSGATWLGWTPDETGRVLFASAEETVPQIHRRAYRVAQTLDAERRERFLDNLIVWAPRGLDVAMVRGEREGYAATDFSLALREKLNETKHALAILEPLSRFAGPDTETSNAAGTAFIRELEMLTQGNDNPTVLFGHHVTKTGDIASMFAARGSSSLSGGVKAQLNVKHVHDEHERVWGVAVKSTKSNYCPAPPVVNMVWDCGVLRVASVAERRALDARVKAAKERA